MKYSFLALLALTTSITPLTAAEIDAPSTIDAVTVYPVGAEITRVTSVNVTAGDHTLVFDNLPGDLDAQSIRVEGEAGARVDIGSVDSKVVHVSGDERLADERRRLEVEIERSHDELTAIDQLKRTINYQRKLIQDMATRPLLTSDNETKPQRPDSEELGNLFDLVAAKLQILDKRVLDADIRRREINKTIAELQGKITELAPKRSRKSVVTVHLSSDTETSGTFRLRYRVQSAGWRPYYDARLSIGEKGKDTRLSLVRRAEIGQRTTESWDNVALTLSTARPVGATAAPDLPSITYRFWTPAKRENRTSGSLNSLAKNKPFADKQIAETPAELESFDAPARMEQREAVASTVGFHALYEIPGRVSVDNEGTAKKVRIATQALNTQLSVTAAPVLDPNAYLTAEFKVGGDTPLLPGHVLLFRDNVFMGRGHLPMLSPGEQHGLGFGVDDRVRIARKEVRSRESESGLISTNVVRENAWVIEVENLHDFTMPVTVYDRAPYATHEDITVELLPGTTKPDEQDVDRKRGVHAWTSDVEAGGEMTINFGYRVTSPKDRPIMMSMH